MNKQERRNRIYNKYLKNLNFLIKNKLINGEQNIYLCPICLNPHEQINSNNPLTLEDAPPKSLGGKPNTLTCKKCNNECGYKIDSHLVNRMRDLDKPKLFSDSSTQIKLKIDNEIIRAEMNIDNHGNQKFKSSIKNNNPSILHSRMEAGKKIENISIIKTKTKPDNLEYAILKTAYLMHFEKFGYLFILNKSYDKIREQLKNPNERIYPKGFWITQNLPESYCGSFLLKNNNIKSFVSTFILDTGKSKTMFIAQLPLPNSHIQNTANYSSLEENLKQEKEINLNLYPNPNLSRDFLFNMNDIRELITNLK